MYGNTYPARKDQKLAPVHPYTSHIIQTKSLALLYVYVRYTRTCTSSLNMAATPTVWDGVWTDEVDDEQTC